MIISTVISRQGTMLYFPRTFDNESEAESFFKQKLIDERTMVGHTVTIQHYVLGTALQYTVEDK